MWLRSTRRKILYIDLICLQFVCLANSKDNYLPSAHSSSQCCSFGRCSSSFHLFSLFNDIVLFTGELYDVMTNRFTDTFLSLSVKFLTGVVFEFILIWTYLYNILVLVIVILEGIFEHSQTGNGYISDYKISQWLWTLCAVTSKPSDLIIDVFC